MGCAMQTGLGYSIFGVTINKPDFSPHDWWDAFVIATMPGEEGRSNTTNVLTGTLTEEQKALLVKKQTAAMIHGGADPATAAAQANSDVTNVLLANNADPSQKPGFDWMKYGAIAAAVVAGIILIKD